MHRRCTVDDLLAAVQQHDDDAFDTMLPGADERRGLIEDLTALEPARGHVADRATVAAALANGAPADAVASLTPFVLGLADLASEPTDVVAVADALGRLWSPVAIAPLRAWCRRPEAEVRLAVVQALFSSLAVGEDPDALDGRAEILALTADPDDDVRDWAMVALGQSGLDGDDVRSAFVVGLNDGHDPVVQEARSGLAIRGDERALASLEGALASGAVARIDVEVAGRLAEARLVPLLEGIESWWTGDGDPDDAALFAWALARCRCEPGVDDDPPWSGPIPDA
jgi:hypothetical protein